MIENIEKGIEDPHLHLSLDWINFYFHYYYFIIMLLFLIIIHKLNCLSYNFQADQNYLLIELISE